MNIRIMSHPCLSGRMGHLPPEYRGTVLSEGRFCPELVGVDSPLGGGDAETGWYAVREVEVPDRDWLVAAFASEIWGSQSGRDNDPDLPEDHEVRIAEAELDRLGY